MQILVVVAINQVRTLMTEVDKGSGRTEIVLGLVGPKGKDGSSIREVFSLLR